MRIAFSSLLLLLLVLLHVSYVSCAEQTPNTHYIHTHSTVVDSTTQVPYAVNVGDLHIPCAPEVPPPTTPHQNTSKKKGRKRKRCVFSFILDLLL